MSTYLPQNYQEQNQQINAVESALLSHSLLPAVVATNVFQAFQLNFAPLVKKQEDKEDGMNPDVSTQVNVGICLSQAAELVSQIKRHQQQAGATETSSLLDISDINGDLFQQQSSTTAQTSPELDAELSEFLIKSSALSQVHQAEIELLDTMLDSYLKDVRETLQVSEGSPAPTPTIPILNSPGAVFPSTSSFGTASFTTSAPSPVVPNIVPQMASPGMPAAAVASASGSAQPPGYNGKKPEDMLADLKKKYSGQVLQVAQSKKKKKNFSKDATDHLNMWFFNHLHDPYPTDDEKKQLAASTNLSLSQVNNWFGNKRMRYKRKMLEQNRRAAAAGGAGGSASMSPPSSPDDSQYSFPPQQMSQGGFPQSPHSARGMMPQQNYDF